MKRIIKAQRGRLDLQSFERLERLQSFQRPNATYLHRDYCLAYTHSYEQVPIADDSVIYCDIPYRGTHQYDIAGGAFDYDRFYEWALQQTQPIFISEYDMPDDFVCIAALQKTCCLSLYNNHPTVEKIFIPRHQQYDSGLLF